MSRPRTEDLETFLAVIDAGGLGAAARALGIPKSTVSRRLARLEADLKTQLVQRSSRRIVLTDHGARMLEHCRDLLSDLDAFVDEAAGPVRAPRGRLRITVPDDLTAYRKHFVDFMVQHPGVEVQIEFTNRMVDVLREGLDLALRGGPGNDPALIARRVGTYDLWAVAAPSYIDREGVLEDSWELRTRDCVLLKAFSDPRWNVPRRREGARHLVANDLRTVLEATRAGLGVAVLPHRAVADDLESGTLVPCLAEYNPLRVPLYAVYPSRRFLPAAAAAFIDHVKACFG
ncbi:MAG: LysR family transcriptional regulator [Myxococcota bacterium]